MPPSHALSLMSAQISMGSPPARAAGSPAFPWSLVVIVLVLGGAIALAARAFRRRVQPRPRSRDASPLREPHGAHTTGGDA